MARLYRPQGGGLESAPEASVRPDIVRAVEIVGVGVVLDIDDIGSGVVPEAAAGLSGNSGTGGDLVGHALPGQRIAKFNISLPRNWTPDLPATERWRLEAEAFGRYCWFPWRIWLGNMMRPAARDLDAELSRLCQLADLLCLDLVVEARQRNHGGLVWDIRYDLPGDEIPTMPYANGEGGLCRSRRLWPGRPGAADPATSSTRRGPRAADPPSRRAVGQRPLRTR
ncbi:hypothetical protein GCM10027290_55820 [Micromonospora sonneratiae]